MEMVYNFIKEKSFMENYVPIFAKYGLPLLMEML